MKPIFLDYETLYTDEYSLRKMSAVEYILDPRFECHGCAVKIGYDGRPFWLDGNDLPRFFSKLDPNQVEFISHNALFDACITAWIYGFVPKRTGCTLSIARAVWGVLYKRLDLNNLSIKLGFGYKTGALPKVKGMTLEDIKLSGLYSEYVDYAINDVELCAKIYKRIVVDLKFPQRELDMLDMVMRMTIQPQFYLDGNLVREHLTEVVQQKDELLATAMLAGAGGKADLMSNEKFAELLRSTGVEPPMKVSPVTGLQAYAFAKTDEEFLALEEHPDPRVQALFAARLGHKTTLEESRSQRFIAISDLTWPDGVRGRMPMPLNYAAAHTFRLGGAWKLNVQNMRRGGKLRRALIVPDGHKVVTVDASQVEARGVAWISGQRNLVEQFARGEDVYASFASTVFGIRVDKKTHPTERFVGKQAILGLGYGLGWVKFQGRLKTDSKNQTGNMISLEDEAAIRVVDTYRNEYTMVPASWRKLNHNGILALAGQADPWVFGPVEFTHKEGIGYINLPNDMKLVYPEVHRIVEADGRANWVFKNKDMNKRIYGGYLMENIMQALCCILTMDTALRINQRLMRAGITLALQVHDELVYVVPNKFVDLVAQIVHQEMIYVPEWARSLHGMGFPIAAEVGIGNNYEEAK